MHFCASLSIYVCKGKLLLMVLTETKLRSVVREELYQYLIEEGFFDKIKSGFQRLTGRGQTQQQTTTPVSTSQNQADNQNELERSKSTLRTVSNKYLNDMMRGRFTEIKNERELNYLVSRFNNVDPKEALMVMLHHLLFSMQLRQDNNTATEKEKLFYGNLLKGIARQIEEELQDESPQIFKENQDQRGVAQDDVEISNLKKRFMIPEELWQKTSIAFSNFIFNVLVEERKLRLVDLFKDNELLNLFITLREFLKLNPFRFETKLRGYKKPDKPIRATPLPGITTQTNVYDKFFGTGQKIGERKEHQRKK